MRVSIVSAQVPRFGARKQALSLPILMLAAALSGGSGSGNTAQAASPVSGILNQPQAGVLFSSWPTLYPPVLGQVLAQIKNMCREAGGKLRNAEPLLDPATRQELPVDAYPCRTDDGSPLNAAVLDLPSGVPVTQAVFTFPKIGIPSFTVEEEGRSAE